MNVTMPAPPRLPLAACAPALLSLAACLPAPPVPRPPPAVRLVLTERWSGGGRLVVVDDAGDRQAVLVPPPPGPPTTTRDEQAAFSPDGQWIAFASTRGRDLDHTALWLVAARVGATAVPLTDGGGGSDVAPTWTPDGAALVFASDRAGTYDLYRLPIDRAHAAPAAPPQRLTDAPSQEVAASVAPDGRIAAQVIELGLAPRSYLALVGAGGALEPLTDGPLDLTPAWAPDGRRLAYASGRLRDDGDEDTDVLVLDTARDRPPAVVADLAGTDERAPAWSSDGRWLFATSVAPDEAGGARWSSVVVVDVHAPRFEPRMLRDHVGAIVRAGVALAPGRLDELALLRAPAYAAALAEALRELDEAATSEPAR